MFSSACCLGFSCALQEWGNGANCDRLKAVLEADTEKKIKAVMIVHNETTTGVTRWARCACTRPVLARASQQCISTPLLKY